MTIEYIEELLDIVTQNFYQAGSYEAMKKYGGIPITQEEINGHEKYTLENRKQLIEAIKQYGKRK